MRTSSLACVAVAAAGAFTASPLLISAQGAPASAPTCVAIVLPSVQGATGDASTLAASVRDLFISYLNGPSIRAISLEARLPSQAAIEARQKECGQMLVASIIRKRPGGNSTASILGQAAGVAVGQLPYAGGVNGAIAAGAAIAGGQALNTFAAETRKKDEVELAYRFGVPESVERARPVTAKAKAKSDGEDLVTPLVERAAAAVASAASRASSAQ